MAKSISPKFIAAVTGAFSYSGAYIAKAFLAAGWEVRTLTRSPNRPHPLQKQISAFPLDFSDPTELSKSLKGAEVLINTYWVRFNHGDSSFAQAIKNSQTLFRAAHKAGVKKIIHLSVSNPDINSELPYYAGKAQVEQSIIDGPLPYSIIRPTLIFGKEELLVSNITWLIRKVPVFAIPGDGKYRLQPIFVEDLARLVLEESLKKGNAIIQAGGPEIIEFRQFIQMLVQLTNSRTWIFNTPARLALLLSKLLGLLLRDQLLTADELAGLIQERLFTGKDLIPGVKFSDWLRSNAALIGQTYTHELMRHHQKTT